MYEHISESDGSDVCWDCGRPMSGMVCGCDVRWQQADPREPTVYNTDSTYYPPGTKKLKLSHVIHETPKARLFVLTREGRHFNIWVPKSCILTQTNEHLEVSQSFYRSSVIKQMKEQL